MNKKRLLGIILSIVLVLGLTPVVCMTARADEDYHLWIGGEKVTATSGSGWEFTPGTSSSPAILSLNGADITYNDSSEIKSAIKYESNAQYPLIIEFSGDNTIRGSNTSEYCGIENGSKDITITGSGTLNVFGNYGIDSSGSVTIGAGEVNATGVSSGIYSSRSVTISGGKVKVTATADSSIGIIATEGIYINGGNVNASGSLSALYSIVYANIEIHGGNVTATSNGDTGSGICADNGTITISGGTITATGNVYGIRSREGSLSISGKDTVVVATATNDNSYGIYAYSNITIGGGKVTTNLEGDSVVGIYASAGTVTITDGTVEAICTGTWSQGIHSQSIDISGGSVKASGDLYGIRSYDLGSLTISGKNTVVEATATSAVDPDANAIYAKNDINISGGTITASGKGAGIYSDSGTITLSGGNTKATADVDDRWAICSHQNNVIIKGENTVVEATATGDNSCGILAVQSIAINGGNVTASGKEYGLKSYYSNTTISGGTVTAKTTGSEGCGIYAELGDITIDGGTVNANLDSTGKTGISTYSGNVTIAGGNVNVSGNTKAIDSKVVNEIKGIGWNNTEGTGDPIVIYINDQGEQLDYKKVQFPCPVATVTTPPEARNLTYNGQEQDLVTAGVSKNGTMKYALGTTAGATTTYSESIPKGKEVGTYYIWYYVEGDTYYSSTTPAYITVSIKSKPSPTPVTPSASVKTAPVANTLTYDGQVHELVIAGEAKGGTMQYALGESKSSKPTSGWSESIPTGTEAGDYFVWYRAKGDSSHTNSVPKCVTATIGKAPSSVTTVPTVKILLCNGEPQELITAGEATGGTIQYALGTDETTAPEDGWSTEIPTGTDAGTYYIWYKVVGDNDHEDSEPSYAGAATIIENHSDNALAIDEEKGIATVKDDVSGGTTEVPLYVITEGLTYRMYNSNSGEHFYTKNPDEVEGLINLGWRHESDSDFTVVSATDEDAVPVYRLYNPNCGGMHFYTTDAEEAKYLKSIGWNYEGISHYVYKATSTKGTPQHRLYNPNSPSAEHLWTSDEAEADMLVEVGWIYEGICWRIV